MHGLQCGFCTPGMITRAYRLLKENPNPTEDEIRYGISGNLCRCTGYQNIVKAIQYAAAEARRRAVPGGRRMNAMTATSAERAEKLEGIGLPAQARRGRPLHRRARATTSTTSSCPACCTATSCARRYAHARIKNIDTTKARRCPACVAVLTAETLKTVNLAWMPTLAGDVQMVLADGKVLFQNQEVAFVIATDRYAAADGAELVEVEYEELPVQRRSAQGDGRRTRR